MVTARQARGAASAALRQLIADLAEEETVVVGEVVRRLGNNGFGLALIAPALPAMIPIPGPFGMITGCCLLLVAWQMLKGNRRLALPVFLADRHVTADGLRRVVAGALPWLHRLEAVMRHDRWRSRIPGSCR